MFDRHDWLHTAVRRDSPHFDARPSDSQISLLVVHCISLPRGQFGGPWVDGLFMQPAVLQRHPALAPLAAMRVSSHFLIDRQGHLRQYVSCQKRAWHAGVSSFAGQAHCNDFSIGIELEGTDDGPFTTAQYAQLLLLTRQLTCRYPIRYIRGHAHIAPGRKTDPGEGFEWSRYASQSQLPRRWFPAT